MYERNLQFINNSGALIFNGTDFAINSDGGNAWAVKDFRNIIVTVVGTGTVYIHGSAQIDPPDFNSASTIDNSHALITTKDYAIQNIYYNGSVGIVVGGGATKIVEVNSNVLAWLAFERTVETVDVIVTVSDNI
jgi:hypothetical protein